MEQQHQSAGKDFSYSYEAALRQLNIKPETLSITDSDSDFAPNDSIQRNQ